MQGKLSKRGFKEEDYVESSPSFKVLLLLLALEEAPTPTQLADFDGEVGPLVCLWLLVASNATSKRESRETLKHIRGDAIIARDKKIIGIGKGWLW